MKKLAQLSIILAIFVSACQSNVNLVNPQESSIRLASFFANDSSTDIKRIVFQGDSCEFVLESQETIEHNCNDYRDLKVNESKESWFKGKLRDAIAKAVEYHAQSRLSNYCYSSPLSRDIHISWVRGSSILEFYFLPLPSSIAKILSCGVVERDIRVYFDKEQKSMVATYGSIPTKVPNTP